MTNDFQDFIDRYHRALNEFMTGDAQPALLLFSRGDEVTLANPFGPVARGIAAVRQAAEGAATHNRSGRATGFDRFGTFVAGEFAYIVEVERYEAKVGRQETLSPLARRVTSVCRRESEGWKIVHRHADPITTVQSAESVLRK